MAKEHPSQPERLKKATTGFLGFDLFFFVLDFFISFNGERLGALSYELSAPCPKLIATL